MSFVDLKLTESDKQEEMKEMEKPMMEQDVPWGLQLNLEDREIEKLGLKDRSLKVGQEMDAMVKVRVSRVNDSESEEGGKKRSVSLSVIGMDIEGEDKNIKASNVLFGE